MGPVSRRNAAPGGRPQEERFATTGTDADRATARALRGTKQAWNDWGSIDPLWSIITDPRLQHGKWAIEEFWRLGEDEISHVMSTAANLGLPATRNESLDFGCGVGRLTRAMTRYFSHCTGVDVAETMIDEAERLNQGYPCRFLVNDTGNLAQFEDSSFDFVYTALVLQHLPTVDVIRTFIAEFLRVLKPHGGLLAFQLPTYVPPRSLRNRLRLRTRAFAALSALGLDKRVLYDRFKLVPVMQMNFIPKKEVLAYLRSLGACVLEVQCGEFESGEVESATYFVTKPGEGNHSVVEGPISRGLQPRVAGLDRQRLMLR